MNLILFEAHEVERPLARADARARHLLDVLRRGEGDAFDAGVIDGPRGKGIVREIGADALRLEFAWGAPPPALWPITLVLGLPRPQTVRKILQEATALGVGELRFVTSERGEPGYATSTVWRSGEWRRHLIAGAEQAFCTRLPRVRAGESLATALAALPGGGARVALDNYESPGALSAMDLATPLTLAFGPERGWSAAERTALRMAGFAFAHLGERVLRAETAVVAAVAIARAKHGTM
ncbi:16S rRNA (uracil(1498)-N(3))-methyltransferase [Horticoccus luteus]|uniref:Ribosomal RNA small subunit methyltransferase E n=1 Tax=Horticoccus luteus TaxID=2862869 RepID=A0A8F9TU70_9BACT|nr:RsmE family RNA methyltransferase [Horticoccus luteus]QYM79349.1 16S rRNA (uracil(1498)-N(3))-methyltransferase [Horticoccus luteus]